MPSEMVGAGENVAGGIRTQRRPMYNTPGGPWETAGQQDIGASNAFDRGQWLGPSDPRCECVEPFDPRTETK